MKKALIRENFCDSGAFSILKKARLWGNKRERSCWDYYDTKEFYSYMDSYAYFVKKYRIAIDRYANVDAILNPELSLRNQCYLEEKHGLRPVPVVHYGSDPKKWIQIYINKGYTFIGLGLDGRMRRLDPANRRWLDLCFDFVCSNPKRLPCVRMHGFGFTSWRLITRYPWYCMTEEDHQVLTRNGWKSLSNLTVGQEILAYNDGKTEWQKIEEIPSYDVKNVDMIHMYNSYIKGIDAYVTWNHNWRTVYREDHSIFRTKQTCQLNDTDIIPRNGDYKSAPEIETHSNNFVRLAAWYWTEGSVKYRKKKGCKKDGVIIYQSKSANPHKVKMIRKCLIRLKERFCESIIYRKRKVKERYRYDTMIHFELYGKQADKLLSMFPKKRLSYKFILSLTKDQLEIFIHTSILADGHARQMPGSRCYESVLAQAGRNRRNIKYFRFACILAGYITSERSYSHLNDSGTISKLRAVRLCKAETNKFVKAKSLKRDVFRYTGKLWCVRVRSGAFLTKCNGCVYVTGNSVDSSVWTQAAGYGNIYIPRKIGSRFDFTKHPYAIKVTETCKARSKHGQHILTLRKAESKVLMSWLDYIEVPFGNEVPWVEGVSNSVAMRRKANVVFFQRLAAAQPEYPWPFPEVTHRNSFGYYMGGKK